MTTGYTESQILAILKQYDDGIAVIELCRQHGISSSQLYQWRAKYNGKEAALIQRIKQLEDDNARLQNLYVKAQLPPKQQVLNQDVMLKQQWSGSRDAIILLNTTHQVLYFNAAAAALFANKLVLDEHLPFEFPHFVDSKAVISWCNGTNKQYYEIRTLFIEWQQQIVQRLSVNDLTQRKQEEVDLRLFKRAVDASYNGISIVDIQQPDHPIIYVNKAFERLTGYSSSEVIGRNCRLLQAEPLSEAVRQQIHFALQEHQECNVVVKNVTKDGTVFWNDLYLAPVPNERGEISHFIGVQNDITVQKKYEHQQAYTASHDLLTEVGNRSHLLARLNRSCQLAQKHNRKIALLYIDLDRFNLVNVSLGYDIGDLVLIEVSKRLKKLLGSDDTLARIANDDFIIVLSDQTASEEIAVVAKQILASLSSMFEVASQQVHLTASIGITLTDGNIDDPAILIQQADMAMIRAKRLGHNNYQWYSQELDIAPYNQLTLRNELQKAILAEALELYYQPQIDARSGKVVGLEALLRWQHQQLGHISPAEFIPLAEDTGQIIPLGTWVIENACRYLRKLLDKGFPALSIAINVSSLQIKHNDFVSTFTQPLKKYQLPAQLLEIEITESVLFANTDNTINKLMQLKSLGIKLAIDDFGTGYSNLSFLKLIPFDKIKIDQTFIQDVTNNRHDAAITKAIIVMANQLQVQVLAEGVETEEQAAFLRKNHCDKFQGYHFAKPMPEAELETFLTDYIMSRQFARISVTLSDNKTLLILDDELNVIKALVRVLRHEDYNIITANSAAEAFKLLALHNVDVILSDQRMPDMSGTEFFSQIKEMYPQTIRMVLSGYTDLKSVTSAVNEGAIYRFLTKPWNEEQLRTELRLAFKKAEQIQPSS
jgi:diguanylate cyclase (GGDEF)-like protein/PAS domain S-box-containing protein